MKSAFQVILSIVFSFSATAQLTYPIVDTDVSDFYDDVSIINAPSVGGAFYGQDATYSGNQPSYTNNVNGTVTDNVTGLMWQNNMGAKISFTDAVAKADSMTLGGYTDWRIPTIKELYSLALFTGRCFGDDAVDLFIDTMYFDQPIGDVSIGEREIDGQTWSSTYYVGLTMNGDTSIFGYNFVDGRLKAYPKYDPASGAQNSMYFRMVRGVSNYGVNNFQDNGDGTITDNATGLMWQQTDDGNTYDWENALSYSENLSLAGHTDWRMPNAKELQSIIDYTRSPSTSSSPAIDPLFSCTSIVDPYGNAGQYGHYWTGSPLQDGPNPYSDAVYFCFGKAQGEMESPPNSGSFQLLDVHGAGAQRNDPKSGNSSDFPDYFGPQGDVRYVFNFVRCVRDVNSTISIEGIEKQSDFKVYPNPASSLVFIENPQNKLSKIEIIGVNGLIVSEIYSLYELISIDISKLGKGLYLVRISSENEFISKKLVVE